MCALLAGCCWHHGVVHRQLCSPACVTRCCVSATCFYRVLLHSNRDAVEVFLVQHAAQHGDSAGADPQQAMAAAAANNDAQAQLKQEQQELLQALVPQQPSGVLDQQQSGLPAAAAAIVGPDISMEPPGHLGDAAGTSAVTAAGPGRNRPPALQQQHLGNTAAAAQASPITLLAKAIGSGNIQPHDVPLGNSIIKQEQNGHYPAANGAGVAGLATAGSCQTPNFATMAGLNSPLFPAGISSPHLSCVASPAQQAKWAENCGIDPEIWFATDDGNALGMGDMFKDNTSIYQPPAIGGEQHDTDLVAAW